VSKANRRYIRTLVLALLAMSTLIWAAIDQFGIAPREMMALFLATAIGAGGIILAAGTVVVIWIALRKLTRRNRD